MLTASTDCTMKMAPVSTNADGSPTKPTQIARLSIKNLLDTEHVHLPTSSLSSSSSVPPSLPLPSSPTIHRLPTIELPRSAIQSPIKEERTPTTIRVSPKLVVRLMLEEPKTKTSVVKNEPLHKEEEKRQLRRRRSSFTDIATPDTNLKKRRSQRITKDTKETKRSKSTQSSPTKKSQKNSSSPTRSLGQSLPPTPHVIIEHNSTLQSPQRSPIKSPKRGSLLQTLPRNQQQQQQQHSISFARSPGDKKKDEQESNVSLLAPNKIRIRLRPSAEETPPAVKTTNTDSSEANTVTRSTVKELEKKRKKKTSLPVSPSPVSPSPVSSKKDKKDKTSRKSNTANLNTPSSPTPSTTAFGKSPRRSSRSFHKNGKEESDNDNATTKTNVKRSKNSKSSLKEVGGMEISPFPEPETPKEKESLHAEEMPIPSSPIMNNEFCSACNGTGTLICCEACPKSFHFLCTDPPIDPENVPDENWFCLECKVKNYRLDSKLLKSEIKGIKDIWHRLAEYSCRMNPKAFMLPKRIRKMLQEPEPLAVAATANKKIHASGGTKTIRLSTPKEGGDSKFIESKDLQPTTSNVKTINLYSKERNRLVEDGFCHVCGRTAMPDCGRLLISCDDCSLCWHLDCLPYPLAVYPSSHRHWACPIHLNRENLSHLPDQVALKILEAGKTTIQINDWPFTGNNQVPILPEASIKLNFGWATTAGEYKAAMEMENFNGCQVPDTVKEAYLTVRKTSAREVKLLQYYEHFSYMDSSVETNLVIL